MTEEIAPSDAATEEPSAVGYALLMADVEGAVAAAADDITQLGRVMEQGFAALRTSPRTEMPAAEPPASPSPLPERPLPEEHPTGDVLPRSLGLVAPSPLPERPQREEVPTGDELPRSPGLPEPPARPMPSPAASVDVGASVADLGAATVAPSNAAASAFVAVREVLGGYPSGQVRDPVGPAAPAAVPPPSAASCDNEVTPPILQATSAPRPDMLGEGPPSDSAEQPGAVGAVPLAPCTTRADNTARQFLGTSSDPKPVAQPVARDAPGAYPSIVLPTPVVAATSANPPALQPSIAPITPPQLPAMASPQQADGSASGPASGCPIHGDVYLDGVRVGRWLSDVLAKAAGGPAQGMAGFDPRLSPRWPGSLQGY